MTSARPFNLRAQTEFELADKAAGERRHDARTNMCELASTARAFG
jgi:hypothetical protein